MLTWTATTDATPPWAITDSTPPALRLRGARVQRPLRRDGVVVLVQCPKEACAARASTTVAGVGLTAATRTVRPGSGRTFKLALSIRARRAIRSALRSRPAIGARIRVVARDAAGNRTTASRTITLRR